MIIYISIENVQHIKSLDFDIDISNPKLICLVGKNGSGKTTLVRAFQNIKNANTFRRTASPYIFKNNSKISYMLDESVHEYEYNESVSQLDSKTIIDQSIKNDIFVEQPIPHGIRFNHIPKLMDIDEELRQKITLMDYETPHELINFLKEIYSSERFSNLKEVKIKGEKYYFILRENNFYIREDYFSSGEYFVVHLFKLIQKKCKLLVIDELDISLDSSAQVSLITQLKRLISEKEITILFTTHSLALIKTLDSDQLLYMENINGDVTVKNSSYNYIKSLLFGFKGWDKYILVEDSILEKYIYYTISRSNFFYKYKIIYIGGCVNVVDLLKRNQSQHFFSGPENVIAILDGDVSDKKNLSSLDKVYFIPFDSVEKYIAQQYDNNTFDFSVTVTGSKKKYAKNLYRQIIKTEKMTEIELFDHINKSKYTEVESLVNIISEFLSPTIK